MAKNSEHNRSAAELAGEIERSRLRVSRNLTNLREELDFPAKIRRSFRRQPVGWILAAVTIGLVLSAISTRRKNIRVQPKQRPRSTDRLFEAGFLLGTLKLAATVLKPIIVPFLQEKVRKFSARPRA
jgi:hypothetical protein